MSHTPIGECTSDCRREGCPDEEMNKPVITLGKYAGKRIDTLPNSYLRWMITQDFPKEWMDCAKEKLEQSDHSDLNLNISRHAIDMFSKRFLTLWIQSEGQK